MSDTYIHEIDNTIDSVKKDFPTSVKSVAKAVHEINKYKRITEAMFDEICERFNANKNKVEAIIVGNNTPKNQRESILRHIVSHRSITDTTIRKKFGSLRPEARMKEMESVIEFNRREQKAGNGTEYVRFELIRVK